MSLLITGDLISCLSNDLLGAPALANVRKNRMKICKECLPTFSLDLSNGVDWISFVEICYLVIKPSIRKLTNSLARGPCFVRISLKLLSLTSLLLTLLVLGDSEYDGGHRRDCKNHLRCREW